MIYSGDNDLHPPHDKSQQMKKELSPEEALYRAAALCSTAEKCKSEIEEKLSRWGISATETRRIVERLEQEKYIDESRYCRSFVNDKIRFDHWGRMKIIAALRQKRIENEHIQAALSQIDEDSYRALLQELLTKKQRSLGDEESPANRAKLVRFAVSRGFEPGLVFTLLGTTYNRDSYDD